VDWGKFKTPTLRDVTKTGPYMHDGRFKTLEEVVDFYDKGGLFGRVPESSCGAPIVVAVPTSFPQ